MVDVGNVSVVALKSGLHPAYDGPDVPMLDLWRQMISEVQPKLVITTGTGGGIGSDVLLGDVIIAAKVRFDSDRAVQGQILAHASYACSPLNEKAMEKLITEALLKPNGHKLKTPRVPVMIYPSAPNANVVTTDTFAFDDSTDHFKLQALGKCCDMGDAVLGLALSNWSPPSGVSLPTWVAIRNASDSADLQSQRRHADGAGRSRADLQRVPGDHDRRECRCHLGDDRRAAGRAALTTVPRPWRPVTGQQRKAQSSRGT